MQINKRPPVKIFISYAHKDQGYLEELTTHFSLLRREGLIADWSDRKIVAGQDWERQIDSNLELADLIIFLVSPDFIASDYCYGKELVYALEKHDIGKGMVLPIIIRPCEWHAAPFSRIQALPKEGLPISKWEDRDDAWLDTIRQIRIVIEQIAGKNESRLQVRELKSINECLYQVVENIEQVYALENKEFSGYSTGFVDLDRAVDGLHPSDLLVICSTSSIERSDLAINIATLFATKSKLPVLIFSMRLSATEVTRRMTSSLSYIPPVTLANAFLDDDDWSKITHALGILNDTSIFVNDSAVLSLKDISAQIDKVIQQKEGGLVVIDSVQHLQESIDCSPGEYGSICQAIKRLAREKNCTIIITSRVSRNSELRPNKRPVLSDLEEWRGLEDNADQLVFVHREEPYNPDSMENKNVAELIVAKNAYGRLSTIYLCYSQERSFYQLLATQ